MTDRTIKFNYLKSSHYMTLYCDGAFGGITPRGMISMAVYNERLPIPRVQEGEIDSNGKLGELRTTSGRSGVVRLVESELTMTPETALVIADWLKTKAEEAMAMRQDRS